MSKFIIKNSSGKIFYGMHFYPGLAQYDESVDKSYKIFLNEQVLRKMDPTFAGKPIFVEHVQEVSTKLEEVRKDADGWVVESFFNEADGKHWVKMVIVSEKAEQAIKNGYKLSNAYVPKLSGKSGLWNNIPYNDEVVGGEYEHLAIVQNPRYAESVIMSPDEFKHYNESLKIELEKIANSKEKNCMKLKFWNRKPVENSIDIESISVTLPKSGIEFSIAQLVNAMDEIEEEKKKKKENTEKGLATKDVSPDVESDVQNEEDDVDEDDNKKKKMKNKEKDDAMCNEEDEAEMEEKKKKENKKMKNELVKKEGHFNKLKDAPLRVQNEAEHIDLPEDQVARGKARYGSK